MPYTLIKIKMNVRQKYKHTPFFDLGDSAWSQSLSWATYITQMRKLVTPLAAYMICKEGKKRGSNELISSSSGDLVCVLIGLLHSSAFIIKIQIG